MFVFFASLLSAVSALDLCCSPDQWQADVGLIMGTVNTGKTSFIEGSMRMSYDALNKIVAYDQKLSVDNFGVTQRIVLDYKNGMMYTIRDGVCNRSNSGDWIPNCVPGNATLLSEKSVYGFGANSIQIKAYTIQMQGYDTNIAVTADTCVPVSQTVTGNLLAIYGGDGKTEFMQSLNFANIRTGIESRSVFFVPAQCESEAKTAQPIGRRGLFTF